MKLKRAFSLTELSISVLIVGALIAAVSQGIGLAQDARLAKARQLTKLSRVSSVKGLVMWLDATSKDSFSSLEDEDGDSVSRWHDINPQRAANDFTQTVNSKKPIHYESLINKLPGVKFDGTADYMESIGFSDIDKGFYTIFIALKTPASAAAEYSGIVSKRLADGSGMNIEISHKPDQGFLFNNFSGINKWNIQDDTPYIFSLSSGVNAVRGRINGQAYLDGGGYIFGVNTNVTDYLFLGKQGLTTSPTYFGGAIGELIIYDRALKTRERQAIESYLGEKWKIPMIVAAS